jgi:mannose-6-phosphate isomerase-like protein (cupin superfamily)
MLKERSVFLPSGTARLCGRTALFLFFLLGTTAASVWGQGAPYHLKRSVDTLKAAPMSISSETARYTPIFGAGAAHAQVPKGVRRYGQLTVDPQGASRAVAHRGEELVYYVLEGTGLLGYAGREVPISKDDFFYVPAGTDHRFANPREAPLKVMAMGFSVDEAPSAPTPPLKIASARDVSEQVLGSHGATVTYQLLLGGVESERDRIAAGRRVTSLYLMNFKPGGTNQVHRHENGEEIYLVLQGRGEMAAGGPDGKPQRYAVEAGDAFFFPPGAPVGFFSGGEEDAPAARILAVRSIYPGTR